ncbi:MAG TPA: hypothetical protein DCZ56_05115 [Sutterella sp.]|nr:hypothetical protein [Sutterella sp.]
MKRLLIAALVAAAAQASIAGQYATAFGDCLYKNMSDADKDTLMQWVFVTVGKTSAARQIATIPSAKTSATDAKMRSLIQEKTMGACRNEAIKLLMNEPRTGLRDAVTEVAVKMAEDKISSSALGSFPTSLLGSDTTAKTLQKAGDLLSGFLKK